MKYGVGVNIEAFLQELAATRRAPSTIDAYRRELLYFRDWLRGQRIKDDLRAVSQAQIQAYRDHIVSQDHSADWKARFLFSLKRFCDFLLQEGVIAFNPGAHLVLPKIKRKRLPAYLNQQETARLMEAADPSTPEGLRDRAILETLYSTGMRASECYRLQTSDINFADGVVRINCGKGRKDRVVPIGAAALHLIERYIAEARAGQISGPLFRKPLCRRAIDSYDLRKILKRNGERVGIGIHLHPHLLRHSFAVHLLENGAGIRHIQEMLGHENLVATQIYTRVVPLQLKKVHDAAHPAAHRREKLPAKLEMQKYYRNTGERKGERNGRKASSFSR